MEDQARAKQALQKAVTAAQDESRSPEQRDQAKQLAKRIAASLKQQGAVMAAQPTGQQPDQPWYQGVADFFTGNDRETRATREIPELSEIGISGLLGEDSSAWQKIKATGGSLMEFSPENIVKMLRANTDENVSTFYDEKGNLGVNVGGRLAIINKPGGSAMDAIQLGATTAAFTPAGRAATGAPTALRGAARVGGASAGTQAVISGASEGAGRDASAGEIASEIGMAGGLGAGGEYVGQIVSRLVPFLRQKIRNRGMTQEVRNSVREYAVRLGIDPDTMTDDVIDQLAAQADEAVDPQTSFAIQGEREFDIPLTQGQRSGAQPQLSIEDRMRTGVSGGKAQGTILNFEENVQRPAISRAQTGIQDDIARGGPIVNTGQEAGDALRQGVKTAEQAAKSTYQQAYQDVGEAIMKPEGFRRLLTSTRNALKGENFVTSESLAPATSELLKKINGTLRTLSKAERGSNIRIKPVTLNRIEEIRRTLNQYAGSAGSATDARNIKTMQRAFDDYLDDAVQSALFEGDDAALESLKKARGLYREYRQKFTANPTKLKTGTEQDKAGKFIERIVDANPTDEEVVNALFGASNFSNRSGATMAQRFKEIIGTDSPEWGAVRQEAMRRLMKTNKVNGVDVLSGQKTLKAIDDALEKNGSLVREVFSPEEIARLKRFAAQVKRTQPDLVRSRENPSGTSQVLSKTVGDWIQRIGSLGMMNGEPVIFATGRGVEFARGFRSGTQARNAVRPFRRIQPVKPALIGGSVASGQAAAADE